jgi:hypothetical protein
VILGESDRPTARRVDLAAPVRDHLFDDYNPGDDIARTLG